MKVECFSNNDEIRRYHWPNKVACRPVVGDRIWSDRDDCLAKIVAIEHATRVDASGVVSAILRLELQPIG